MNRIIVMARNEVGVIADISRTLANDGINIETISAEGLDEKGVITLTTDAYDEAPASSDQCRLQDRIGRLSDPAAPGRAGRIGKGSREVSNTQA